MNVSSIPKFLPHKRCSVNVVSRTNGSTEMTQEFHLSGDVPAENGRLELGGGGCYVFLRCLCSGGRGEGCPNLMDTSQVRWGQHP